MKTISLMKHIDQGWVVFKDGTTVPAIDFDIKKYKNLSEFSSGRY